MTDILVINVATGETLAGIPTPRLIAAGHGPAYFVPNDGPSKDRIPGVWYLKDVGYESPTGEYTTVRIRSVDTYPGR